MCFPRTGISEQITSNEKIQDCGENGDTDTTTTTTNPVHPNDAVSDRSRVGFETFFDEYPSSIQFLMMANQKT